MKGMGTLGCQSEIVLRLFNLRRESVANGKAIKTFVRGKLVVDDGQLVARGPLGEYVYPL